MYRIPTLQIEQFSIHLLEASASKLYKCYPNSGARTLVSLLRTQSADDLDRDEVLAVAGGYGHGNIGTRTTLLERLAVLKGERTSASFPSSRRAL